MTPLLESIIKQAEQLSYEEQLELIRSIAAKLKSQSPETSQQRKLSEFRGIVPYPFLEEDAQTWVSHNRQEGDNHRDLRLRGKV